MNSLLRALLLHLALNVKEKSSLQPFSPVDLSSEHLEVEREGKGTAPPNIPMKAP